MTREQAVKIAKTLDDIDCFNTLITTGKEIIVVATKADKLNQKEKAKSDKLLQEAPNSKSVN